MKARARRARAVVRYRRRGWDDDVIWDRLNAAWVNAALAEYYAAAATQVTYHYLARQVWL